METTQGTKLEAPPSLPSPQPGRSDRSATIGKLAGALAKAQGAMATAVADSTNPFYKSKYADLASVWTAIRKPLSDNGLAIVQLTETGPQRTITVYPSKEERSEGDKAPRTITVHELSVTTILVHESGEYYSSTLMGCPLDITPQGIGKTLTYLRRYGVAALVGVAQEDDDGEAGSGRGGEEKPKSGKKQPAATKPDLGASAGKVGASEKQIAAINGLRHGKGLSAEALQKWCAENKLPTKSTTLTVAQASDIITYLKTLPDAPKKDAKPDGKSKPSVTTWTCGECGGECTGEPQMREIDGAMKGLCAECAAEFDAAVKGN